MGDENHHMATNGLSPSQGVYQSGLLQQQPQPQSQHLPTQGTTQQKRQHSNSYQMPSTLKRSVTNPASPSVLQAIPAESSRATTGTTTPANGSLFPPQVGAPSAQAAQTILQQQAQQQFNIQQQMPQFKPSFKMHVGSPPPQLPGKGKKFSQTFINQTYAKQKTPEVPQSPSLSLNPAKYESTSYLNDYRTDVNDFNDTNSFAYTHTPQQPQHPGTTSQPQQQQQSSASRLNQPHASQLPAPQIPASIPPLKSTTPSVIMKEANAESPGSTISEASTNPAAPAGQQDAASTKLTDEEQQLIVRLQDTYKTIIRLENTLQRKCAALNLPQRLDMTELWEIYNTDIQLLNAYYDFLLYAMGSGKSGKQIVEVYRIPRRLWVYGIVTFLDVLKNVVSIFVEHDMCSGFISYAFNILGGLSDLEMEAWLCEKLGDLSRMAIALYPSRFIDWKISSEYWYSTAMKTQYGFGKIYYHIATVQLDSLDALVNIGRSVFCRDTFVPTPQYMRMVIDNINQRTYIDLPVLDFIKLHKILLSNEIVNEGELNKLITFYARNLGVDNNSIGFFTRTPGVFTERTIAPEYSQDNDHDGKFQFWFQRSSSFALVNIFQLVGFGNSDNPFARLFGLLEALKERKERKEKKDKRKKSANGDQQQQQPQQQSESQHQDAEAVTDSSQDLSVEGWFDLYPNLNKFAVKVAMKMMIVYLKGPLITALPLVITTLYFLVAVGESLKKYPKSKPFFESIILTIIPVNSMIRYLNEVMDVVRSKPQLLEQMRKMHHENPEFLKSGFLSHFSQNENLIEVWKCWGSLWFDAISLKEEYSNAREAGISKSDLLDVPIGGALYESKYNNDRFLRVALLASYIADNFNFGIKRFSNYRFGFHVDKVFRDLEFDENAREFVKNAYMDIFKEAKSFDLVETVEIDPSCQTLHTGDLLRWFQANSEHIPQIDTGHVVNYADNDADEEDDDDDDVGDDEGGDDEDYEEDVDHDNGTENKNRDVHITASASYTDSTLPSSIIAADTDVLVGKTITFFVLDTNMWLKHCGRLFKCLRSGLFKLAVPLVVFQELRSLRCSPDATVADAGTRAVITMRQLAAEGLLVPLKLNGTEAPTLNDISDFENNKTWMQGIDEAIINSTRLLNNNLLAIHQKQGDYSLNTVTLTVLITEDRNMRLKSRTKHVAAFQGKWFFDIVERFSEGRYCNN